MVTALFSDHSGLSVEIEETAETKCIYMFGRAFLAWMIWLCGLEW